MSPSLFHLNLSNANASPLRRKGTGTPEHKDLHDNKTSHQCLTLMIRQVSFPISRIFLFNCKYIKIMLIPSKRYYVHHISLEIFYPAW